MEGETLFRQILKCDNRRRCGVGESQFPFLFPLRCQRVMLITACPNLQAALRPLTSVRFFRSVCAALFGQVVSDRCISAFDDLIYWTHLHKCYHAPAFWQHDFSTLPSMCADRWLRRELETLQPTVIIILGEEPIKRVLGRIPGFGRKSVDPAQYRDMCYTEFSDGRILFATGFPVTGAEERFSVIRETLSKLPGFGFMERSASGRWIGDLSYPPVDDSGLVDELRFENTAWLRRVTGDDFPLETADDAWMKHVVLPGMHNREQVLRCQSFLEDQVRSLVMSSLYDEEYRRIYSCTKNAGPDLDGVKAVRDNWQNMIGKLLNYLMQRGAWGYDLSVNKAYINGRVEKLSLLARFRNAIVHQSGYIPADKIIGMSNAFPGVYAYPNLVHVTEEGVRSVKEYMDEMLALVSRAAQSLHKEVRVNPAPPLEPAPPLC